MTDWFERDDEANTLTLTSIRPGVEFDYNDAMSLFEELGEHLGDMEQRERELEAEHEKEYADTDAYLERVWRE